MISKMAVFGVKSMAGSWRQISLAGRRMFSSLPETGVAVTGDATIKKTHEGLREESLSMKDGRKVDVKFNDTTVCYEIPERVGGATYDTQGQYMIMFTCKKCDTKQSKMFTKKAYHDGVVLVRCDGCSAFHLIADNLNWFGDEKTNIETIMKGLNQEMVYGKADSKLLETLQMSVHETRDLLEKAQKSRNEAQEIDNVVESNTDSDKR